MRIIYHSPLITNELELGSVFRAVPGKARLEILTDRGERASNALLNGKILDLSIDTIDIETNAELVINKHTYSVKPLAHPLSKDYAKAYECYDERSN